MYPPDFNPLGSGNGKRDRNCTAITFRVRGGTSCFYFPPSEALGRAVLATTPTRKPQASPEHTGVGSAPAARLFVGTASGISCVPGPSLWIEAAKALVVKLQRGPAPATAILPKQSAEGGSMDTSMDLCDAMGSHTEDPPTLIGQRVARRNTHSYQVKRLIRQAGKGPKMWLHSACSQR